MSWEVARRAIDYYLGLLNSPLRTKSVKKANLAFYGGESLIEFELMQKCVDYVNSKSDQCYIEYLLTTNGTLLTEKVMRFLIKNNFLVYVSLDGPLEEHDRNRVFIGKKGSFETISKNLQKLHDLNEDYYEKRVFFIATYTLSTNLEKVIEFFSQETNRLFYKKLSRLGLISLNGLSQSKKPNIEEIENHTKQKNHLFKKYIDFKNRHDLSSDGRHPLHICWNREFTTLSKKFRYIASHKVETAASCLPGTLKLFVSANGGFHICEKINDQFEIGDCYNGVNYRRVIEVISKFQMLSPRLFGHFSPGLFYRFC